MSKIKLLLVDDSSLVRKILKNFFIQDAEIDVVDEALNGKIALDKILTKEFDIVLLDYEMPEMNGLEFLQAVKQQSIKNKPPVIVFSSLTDNGSKYTVDCLLAGANDYIQKPSSSSLGSVENLEQLKTTIREKILSIVKDVKAKYKEPLRPIIGNTAINKLNQANSKKISLKYPGLVVVGSSTGGPAALEKFLMGIPKDFRYPVLIVQHMPEKFTKILADTLQKNTGYPVQEVCQESKIENGKAYIAMGGKHMIMTSIDSVNIVSGESVNFCIPSVDVLFESVARVFNKGVVSIILTGMGKDGFNGVKALKSKLECFSIVQDQESSVVWSMPKAIHEAGLSDMILPLEQISEVVKNV